MSISRFITRAEVPNRLFGNIRAGQPELGIYNTPQMQYAADNNNESQNAGAFIPEEETGILSLRDILADLGRKGVEGFKDVAGRGIASQALGTAGGMILGPLGYLAGGIFGALKGGDMFKRDPVFSDFSQPGNPTGMRTRRAADRISYMLNRGAAGKNFSQRNLDNMLRGFGMSDVDTQGMMDSIAQSAQTGYGGYGSSDDAAAAAASGGRDYSSSPGAMAGDMEYGEE